MSIPTTTLQAHSLQEDPQFIARLRGQIRNSGTRPDLEIICLETNLASERKIRCLAAEIKNKSHFHPTTVKDTFRNPSRHFAFDIHREQAEKGLLPIRDAYITRNDERLNLVEESEDARDETIDARGVRFTLECLSLEWIYMIQRGQKYGIVTSGTISVIIEVDWTQDPLGNTAGYMVFEDGRLQLNTITGPIIPTLGLMMALLAFLNLREGNQGQDKIEQCSNDILNAYKNWDINPQVLPTPASNLDAGESEGQDSDMSFINTEGDFYDNTNYQRHDHQTPAIHNTNTPSRNLLDLPEEKKELRPPSRSLPPKLRKHLKDLLQRISQPPRPGFQYRFKKSLRFRILNSIIVAKRNRNFKLVNDLLPLLWPENILSSMEFFPSPDHQNLCQKRHSDASSAIDTSQTSIESSTNKVLGSPPLPAPTMSSVPAELSKLHLNGA